MTAMKHVLSWIHRFVKAKSKRRQRTDHRLPKHRQRVYLSVDQLESRLLPVVDLPVPLFLEQNLGQTDSGYDFISHGIGDGFLVSSNKITITDHLATEWRTYDITL
ncbi:MAG: hypothetical protein RMJ82_03430, partial [Gemmatales bacterium]|nr:hypothetical protein [Gemmatales bacterium]